MSQLIHIQFAVFFAAAAATAATTLRIKTNFALMSRAASASLLAQKFRTYATSNSRFFFSFSFSN